MVLDLGEYEDTEQDKQDKQDEEDNSEDSICVTLSPHLASKLKPHQKIGVKFLWKHVAVDKVFISLFFHPSYSDVLTNALERKND